MRTCVSQRASSFGLQPVHFMTEQQAHRKTRLPVEQIDRCTLVSIAAISYPRDRSLRSCDRIRGVFPGNVSSAPSAVFVMAFFGGRAGDARQVQPLAPGRVHGPENDPTLYMLRTLSSSTLTGSGTSPS